MPRHLTLVHTVPSLADRFDALLEEVLPNVSRNHVLAPELLQQTVEAGHLQDRTVEQLAGIVDGLDPAPTTVMVTCSTLGPAVDVLVASGRDHLVRVDEAMARRAVRDGGHLGVLATLASTLVPTVELLRRVADEAERHVEITTELCAGAFEAMSAGDTARHDELVADRLEALAARTDRIVLAQASTARVADDLLERLGVPVLSSPRLAVEGLAAVLEAGESR